MAGSLPPAAHAAERGRTLRRGSAEQAGLLPEHLDRLVADAETFLGPSPEHPWYAGAVLLAGRGGTVALHHPIGSAVRYAAYDEKSDTAVEFPPERQIRAAEDTVYDLASVSKLFTALLAVQQIERGTLELEATVASYLPEFGAAGKTGVTIRQLLTHTSGFREWLPLYGAATHEEMLKLIWNETPANPPGTRYLYSDLNLISLQLVLERITGRRLDALLHDEITAPLGMHRTRYNPPASWKPKIAATEDARKPWSGLDRGLVWGEVHDENAFGLGGVAGHAGVFSCAWDLAVLARTLLNGGTYGRARILSPASVDLLFRDFNTAFPGHEHGLGFELYQHWYMGAMATPRSAGHTGFTGTSLVIDPSTDTFLVLLGNSVHPVRSWRSGSAPRVAAANALARAVAVRPEHGGTAWFTGTATATTATLTLPALAVRTMRRPADLRPVVGHRARRGRRLPGGLRGRRNHLAARAVQHRTERGTAPGTSRRVGGGVVRAGLAPGGSGARGLARAGGAAALAVHDGALVRGAGRVRGRAARHRGGQGALRRGPPAGRRPDRGDGVDGIGRLN